MFYPIGALSHNLEGKELAEMFDMKQAGAVAFSDNKKAIKSSGLMSRALLYCKKTLMDWLLALLTKKVSRMQDKCMKVKLAQLVRTWKAFLRYQKNYKFQEICF